MSEDAELNPELILHLRPDLEIKMVYTLEMDLRRLLPDPETAMALLIGDVSTQDLVLRRALTKTKKLVLREEDLIDHEALSDLDLTPGEQNEILSWVMEHILSFFARRTTSMGKLGQRFGKVIQQVPSMIGSNDSVSPTPSAGASDVSSQTSG